MIHPTDIPQYGCGNNESDACANGTHLVGGAGSIIVTRKVGEHVSLDGVSN